MKRKVVNLVGAQQRLNKAVEERVKNRERQKQAASRGQLPTFAVGDYVMAMVYGGRAQRQNR